MTRWRQPNAPDSERILAGELPARQRKVLANYKRRAGAQRSAGRHLIGRDPNDALTELLPERLVGCADLEASTNTSAASRPFTHLDQKRRLRALRRARKALMMGAMAGSMAAHGGIVPLAVTYLAFADYNARRCAWPR